MKDLKKEEKHRVILNMIKLYFDVLLKLKIKNISFLLKNIIKK
jgi:hypothetical protein